MRVFVRGEPAPPGEDQRRICETGAPASAPRCGTCARACRRSKTSSRARWATHEPDSRSELSPLRGPAPAARPVVDGHRRARASARTLSRKCVPRAAARGLDPVHRPHGPDLRRDDVSARRRSCCRSTRRCSCSSSSSRACSSSSSRSSSAPGSSPPTGAPTRCRSICRSRCCGWSTSAASSPFSMTFLLFVTLAAGLAADPDAGASFRAASSSCADNLYVIPAVVLAQPAPRVRGVVHDAGAVVALEEHALRRDSLHRRRSSSPKRCSACCALITGSTRVAWVSFTAQSRERHRRDVPAAAAVRDAGDRLGARAAGLIASRSRCSSGGSAASRWCRERADPHRRSSSRSGTARSSA